MPFVRFYCLVVALAGATPIFSQTIIKMEKANGIFMMPCQVNGLSLKFVFDTGASDVSISLTEALFMLKNGYLKEADLFGMEYYQIANGDVEEGTKIRLAIISIGDLELRDVEASIVHSASAPLLLGQSALKMLGKIQFDYATGTLTILNAPPGYVKATPTASAKRTTIVSKPAYTFDGTFLYQTTLAEGTGNAPLRAAADINAEVIYRCQPGSYVYVLDSAGEIFSKVHINGHEGYLSKAFLARQQ
ncbi:MAG: retroviral-like aspartic protease family protein [Flavobacteriales bacterium]|nr:retroviral-like aspartic protease family protein [Flavobacteriales bacterium]